MKPCKHQIWTLVFGFFISVFTSASAQEVQIDGKTYEVIKKENLNASTEFIKLKVKGGKSEGESFIRLNNEYYKTNFSAAALKGFLSTGKLSSLGVVKKTKIAGNSIIYIDNGSIISIISYNKEVTGIIELLDQKQTISVRNSLLKSAAAGNGGGTTGDPLLDCGVMCLDQYIACGNSAVCRNAYRKCWSECKNKHQSSGGSGSYTSTYFLPLNNVAIKL